jgi:exonuclease III
MVGVNAVAGWAYEDRVRRREEVRMRKEGGWGGGAARKGKGYWDVLEEKEGSKCMGEEEIEVVISSKGGEGEIKKSRKKRGRKGKMGAKARKWYRVRKEAMEKKLEEVEEEVEGEGKDGKVDGVKEEEKREERGRRSPKKGGGKEWESRVRMNVNGLRGKLVELEGVVRRERWDVVGVTETYLGENEVGSMAGFVWFGVPGKKGKGSGRGSGGVGVFVAEYLAQYVQVVRQGRHDMVWLRFDVETGSKVVGVVYGPDMSKARSVRKEFFEALRKALEEFRGEGLEVIVMGDLNARVGRMKGGEVVGEFGEEVLNENGVLMKEALLGGGCLALNGRKEGEVEWTFEMQVKDGVRRSVVDYVCISEGLEEEVVDFGVGRELDVGGDGHAPVWVEMVWARHRKMRKKEKVKWRLNVAALQDESKREVFEKECAEMLGRWEEGLVEGEIGWEEWKGSFLGVCEKVLGLKRVKKWGMKEKALRNKVVAGLVKKRQGLWKEWVRMEEGPAKMKKWEEFKAARREVRKVVGELRKEGWVELGKEVEESFDVNKKKFWARVKLMNGKSGSCGTGVVRGPDGKLS